MAYNKTMDSIIYQYSNEDKVEIKNEWAWRVALSKMFYRGASRFTFYLEWDKEKTQEENSIDFQNI